jgi:hypothetical protein
MIGGAVAAKVPAAWKAGEKIRYRPEANDGHPRPQSGLRFPTHPLLALAHRLVDVTEGLLSDGRESTAHKLTPITTTVAA